MFVGCLNRASTSKVSTSRLFWILLILCLCNTKAYSQALKLSTFQKSPSQQLSSTILLEAYKQLDINLTVFHIPGNKALHYAHAGKVDGEVSRISGASVLFDNLIRVPEPVNYLEAAVFSKEVDIEIKDWNSISPFVIGVPLGAKFVTDNTKNMRQVMVPSDLKLMTMLGLDELELVVNPLIDGMGRIKQQQLFHLRILHPSLSREYLYHYLHKKHEHLVPKISEAIRNIKSSGRYDELRAKLIANLR